MTKNKKIIGVVALLVVVGLMLGLWLVLKPQSTQGAKEIVVTVVHGDETTNEFTINTDQEFLRFALEEIELVQGDESEYGLYVKTVDGETIDESKQEWWCFTKGGETVMTGVDTTPIADGEVYEITLTVGY